MTQVEVLQNFMGSLDTDTSEAATALDNAIKSATAFDSMQDAIDNMISDCKSASSWKTFLRESCGIILSNEDTGAITGSDAGGDTEKTAKSVVPETGSLSAYKKKSFTTDGLTFTLDKKFSSLTADQKFVWQGLYTWWAKESLNLINESYGYRFSDDDIYANDILVKFYNKKSDGTLAYVSSYVDDDDELQLELYVNTGIFKNLDKTNKNGKAKNTDELLDRTLAHELTHAIMAAKINDYEGLPISMIEGSAELVCGIDDERHDEIIELAQNPDSLRSFLDMTKEESSGTEDYAAGYMFLRYIAQQSADTPIINYTDSVDITGTKKADEIQNYASNVGITAGNGNDTIVSYYSYTDDENKEVTISGVTISGGNGADIITTYSDNVSVNGGAGNDYIETFSDGSKILGGKGDDTIIGGEFNDTLSGGAGKDIFVYAKGGGNDIITDYTTSDKIKITSGKISNSKVSGKNVVFTIGDGSITVKNGKNTNITVIDSSGKTNIYRNNALKSTSALIAEDNFISADNLDSIVDNKFAVADIQTENKISTQENLITFAK